jgi:hypothetical protein
MKMKPENIAPLAMAMLLLAGLIALYHIATIRMIADEDSVVTLTLSSRVYLMMEYMATTIYVVCIGVALLGCAVILWERNKTKG